MFSLLCYFYFYFQEIVDWFNSIRAIQLQYLRVAFPGATDAEVDASTFPNNSFSMLTILRNVVVLFQLVPKLTRNFVKEGYMEKTGPRVSKSTAACLYMCTAETPPP